MSRILSLWFTTIVLLLLSVWFSSSSFFSQAHVCVHDTEVLPFINKHNPPVTIPQYYPPGTLEHGTHGRPVNVLVKTKTSRKTGDSYKEFTVEVMRNKVNDEQRSRSGEAQNFVPANATNAAPMRFTVSTLDLYDNTKYCTTVGGSAPDFKGGSITCGKDEDIFTVEKRDALVNDLIPAAIKKMSEILSVVPLTQPIVGISANVCQHFNIPQDHIDNGVSNTDYVLYVAAGPTLSGNVAWAGLCAKDNTGRPILGRMNCGPTYIKWQTEYDRDKYLATLYHELSHALAYSADAFANNYGLSSWSGPSAQTPLRSVRGGFQAQFLRSPYVLDAVREFYNCPTAEGLELESPYLAPDGTANSHPTRRNLFESFMTGVQGEANVIDNLTLSVFADMQFYFVNFSTAGSMYYGNNTGCGFLEEPCNSTTMQKNAQELFCAKETTTRNMCTYNLQGIGKCDLASYTGDLPNYFEYYKSDPRLGGRVALMQYCPFVSIFSNNRCRLGNVSTGSSTDKLLGHTHGQGGRCVFAPTLISDGFLAPENAPNRCVVMKCLRQETYMGMRYRLQIQIREASMLECPLDGSAANVSAPSGFSGIVECPSAYDVCPPESKGYADDIIYEDLPPLTSTTLTTFYYDNNGSTYTLSSTTSTSESATTETAVSTSETVPPSTPTPAPPTTTTTTSDPRYQVFTISLPDIYSQVFSAVLASNRTGLINALTQDLVKSTSSASVTSVSLVNNLELRVNVDISNTNQVSDFNSLIANGNINRFLGNTANLIATESNNPSITPELLALGSSSLSVSTTAAGGTTPSPNSNNSGSGENLGPIPSEICFLKDQPCWVSITIISSCVSVLIGVIGYVYKKSKANDNQNNNNNNNGGRSQSEREKWNREYGMQNDNAAGNQSPISQMNQEMQQYNRFNRRPSQSNIIYSRDDVEL